MSRYTICSGEQAKEHVIDWSKYFDQIYCIHYLPNYARRKAIAQELERVGILDASVFKFHYTCPNIYDVLALPRVFQQFRNTTTANKSLAYYSIMLESEWLKYNHILILEDDVTFIPDLPKLKDILDHLPEDYDYIHFDKILSRSQEVRRNTMRQGSYYDSGYTGGYWGSGMLAFSYKAIRLAISYMVQALSPMDFLLENRDDNLLDPLKRYVPHETVVQQLLRTDEYKEAKY